jgi:hypothetical protein
VAQTDFGPFSLAARSFALSIFPGFSLCAAHLAPGPFSLSWPIGPSPYHLLPPPVGSATTTFGCYHRRATLRRPMKSSHPAVPQLCLLATPLRFPSPQCGIKARNSFPIEGHQTIAGRRLTASLLPSPLLPQLYKTVSQPRHSMLHLFPLLVCFLQVCSMPPSSCVHSPPFLLIAGQILTTPPPSDTVVRFPPTCSSSRSFRGEV